MGLIQTLIGLIPRAIEIGVASFNRVGNAPRVVRRNDFHTGQGVAHAGNSLLKKTSGKPIGLDTILSPVLRREWQNDGGRTMEDRNCCVNRTSSSCPHRSAILVLAKGPQISDDGMADPELWRDHRVSPVG